MQRRGLGEWVPRRPGLPGRSVPPAQPNSEGPGRGGAEPPTHPTHLLLDKLQQRAPVHRAGPGAGGWGRRPRPGGAALRSSPLRPGPPAPLAASRSRPPPARAPPPRRHARPGHARTLLASAFACSGAPTALPELPAPLGDNSWETVPGRHHSHSSARLAFARGWGLSPDATSLGETSWTTALPDSPHRGFLKAPPRAPQPVGATAPPSRQGHP